MENQKTPDEVRGEVRSAYGQRARTLLDGETKSRACCGGPSCCGPADTSPSTALYGAEDLGSLPPDVSEASWGCGDPVGLAEMRPGDVVVDLGSGGGLDCLLAAQRVGPTGHVIGVDMTPDMLSLAWRNVAKAGTTNVEFRYGTIEKLPVDSGSADYVISNCVINLSPDKDATFREIARVLKPGGRVSVSDIVLLGDLPADLREDVGLYASCVSGAMREADYLAAMRGAGLSDVTVASRVIIDPHEYTEDHGQASRLEGLIASVRVTAHRA